MNTIECKQGSPEWMHARAGIPTASELDQLLTEAGEPRKGEMPRTYTLRKLAERWLGRPVESRAGWAAEQGSILEDEAVPWYELTRNCTLERPGLFTTDDGFFGCSPDGVWAYKGVEIKCPQPVNHVRWLLAGVCPPEHALQVQGGLLVTDWEEWEFVSYCRGFPALTVVVKRDDKIIDAIRAAVYDLNRKITAAYVRLVELNGGPPVEAVEDTGPF